MSWVSDRAITRIKASLTWPEFAGDRYQVEAQIGQGGMGTVYRGTDTALGRAVAIKVTHAAAADSVLETRMREEARVLAALEHPGIVPIHDVGLLADGRLFVVMKLAEGTPLDAAAAAGTLEERVALFARICEPVAFAHARGWLHRDIKPSNVMLGAFGEVLVMDWGLAMRQGSGAGGRGSGTDGWMAPEQERGEHIDARADVFALGRLLAFLLKDLSAPKRLRAVMEKAAAPLAAQRYADAGALAADIRRYRAGEPVEAYPETLLDRAARLAVRYRTALLLILAYLVMRVVIAVVFGR